MTERAYTGPIHDYTIRLDGSPFTFEYRSQSPDVAVVVEEIRTHYNLGDEVVIEVVHKHRITLDTYAPRQIGKFTVYDVVCICGEWREMGALSEISLINDLMEHAWNEGYNAGVRYGSCP